MKHGWEKVPIGNAYSYTNEKGLFLSVYVDDIKLAGKKQNLDPMWTFNKEVDLGDPTSFLDHVYLGCTQRQCEMREDIVDKFPLPQNLRVTKQDDSSMTTSLKRKNCNLKENCHKNALKLFCNACSWHVQGVAVDWTFASRIKFVGSGAHFLRRAR